MNYLWGAMIVIGIIYAAFNGTLPDVTEAAVSSSKEAVTLCITMLGVMSFWVGMMRIAENSGMIQAATRRLRPVLHFFFPNIPKEHAANQHIAANIIANIFGLGWAATPAGLKAMEELGKLEEERQEQADCYFIEGERNKTGKQIRSDIHRGSKNCGKARIASDEMCTFLVINISSLQLIPVNIIAYRSQYGSVNPTAIVGPGIVATLCSTLVAVVFCKIMQKKNRHKR